MAAKIRNRHDQRLKEIRNKVTPPGRQGSRPNVIKRWLFFTWVLLGLPFHAGCDDSSGHGPAPDDNPGLPPYMSVSPANTGDGWATSTPDAEGMDPQVLLARFESIRAGNYPGVDSVIVAKNGVLVAEAYFNGYGPDTLHDLRSTSKSITSALAGIAVEQGILSTEDTLADLVDLDSHQNPDDRKAAIKVLDLLNMNSGLACNDWDPGSPGNEEKMYQTQDWVKFVLDLPMITNPGGAQSQYCTGGVILLGNIISTRAGMNLDDFANAYLFGPLDIQSVQWRRSPDGQATGGGGMRLSPRDVAKFGQLYLNQGVWHGERVIASQWIEDSKQSMTAITTSQQNGYGLLWWKRSFPVRSETQEAVFASGNGGNFIFLFPQENLAVVFTGSNYNSRLTDQPFAILPQGILPALR